jgi:hypothetical protein
MVPRIIYGQAKSAVLPAAIPNANVNRGAHDSKASPYSKHEERESSCPLRFAFFFVH